MVIRSWGRGATGDYSIYSHGKWEVTINDSDENAIESWDTADDQVLRERMKRMQMLKGITLFEGFKGKDLLSIARILHEVEVPQGELVFQEKALGDSLYLVRERSRWGLPR